MQFPSEAAKELAAQLDGVEIGMEDKRMPKDAKERGLVVVYGASDDLMEIRGAIDEEVDCYDGGTFYLVDENVLENPTCECQWAKKAHAEAKARAKEIEALWGDGEYSWIYRTDIPHVCFDVFNEGEKYCCGIVFDIAALA